MLCDTSGVGELSASPSHGFALRASPAVTHGVSPLGTVGADWEVSLFSPSPLLYFSTGSPFGHHPRLRRVCPLRGQWVRTGRLLFSLSLHFSTSPRVRPSGITRGYAWCVPSGDSGCGLGGFPFFSLSTSPRGHPSGITRGYAWCVPSGDSGCGSHHKKSV